MKNLHNIRRYLLPRTPKIGSKGLKEREEGISALMTIRNEPWIEPSILSIQDFVDEVILVDASTKEVSKKVKRIVKRLEKKGINIKYHHMEPSFKEQSIKAIEMSTRKWLLRWDGDFIAYTSGEKQINKLKKITSKLSDKKHYTIIFNLIDLGSDFFHTSSVQKGLFHREPYLFNYSKDLLNEKRALRKIKGLIKKFMGEIPPRLIQHPFPLYYSFKYIDEPFAMHLRKIKPSLRLKERKYYGVWSLLPKEEKEKYSNSFKKFVESKRIERRNINEKNIEKFNYEKYGYPSTLKKWIKEESDLEIEETKEFKKGINEYLLEFEE